MATLFLLFCDILPGKLHLEVHNLFHTRVWLLCYLTRRLSLIPAPSNMPNLFLRQNAQSTARFLLIIFQLSLSSCTLRFERHITRVVPVYKNEDRSLLNNYRPISPTRYSCKITEHFIASCITRLLV